jgi:hypothetical protein
MSTKEIGKQDAVLEKPVENKQLNCTVNGCKVTLNFPAKPEGSAVNDIKRMMLGGVVKS